MNMNNNFAEIIKQVILKSSPFGLTIFDENINIIDCNETMLKLCGASKQYYINNFFEFSPEYQADGVKSADRAFELMKCARRGEVISIEWLHKTIDGEIVPCELTITGINDNGKFTGLSFIYDLRKIKSLSADLQEQGKLLKIRLEQQELISEITKSFVTSGEADVLINNAISRLGQYLAASRIAILFIDYENNDSFLSYSWYSQGAPKFSLPSHEAFSIIKSAFNETLPEYAATPRIFCENIFEHPVLQKLFPDGISSLVAVPLYVEGRLWGVMSVEQCNEKRKWQDIDLSFISTLGDVIASAIMRSTYNEKINDALKHATAASEAKSSFLSNMSHEIRTPMNAIIGMTAIGKAADDMTRKNYCFEKIENASQHLLGVINDVLDMSKIEANKFELSNVEFNFEKMLQRVVSIIAFRADEKKQNLTVNIDKSIPRTLIGDDQRLAQVITNLLGNAIKFTSERGSIKLDTRFLGEENGVYTIRIAVKDSGIGISPEQQQHLFHSFEQADSKTSRRYGGTGLGLVISKNIIEQMGGSIELESDLGKGSSFSFTFKAKHGNRMNPCLSEAEICWNNVSVLAVDDDQETLDHISGIIQSFGTNCDTALSTKEAMALINTNGMYDIYLIDWKMPDMDGIKLAEKIKNSSDSQSNAVIIMISAAEWSSVADEAKKSGVDKFLSKPLFPSAIMNAIIEAIGIKTFINGRISANSDGLFKGYKILLAEDIEINREIVLTLVEASLLEVDCAENGLEAVNMFKKFPGEYDLILMDLQMPEMDGYQATHTIRAIEAERNRNLLIQDTDNDTSFAKDSVEFAKQSVQASTSFAKNSMEFASQTPKQLLEFSKRIPIIAMTANVFREDIEKCLDAGMNDHIGKPLDVEELFIKLKKYLIK